VRVLQAVLYLGKVTQKPQSWPQDQAGAAWTPLPATSSPSEPCDWWQWSHSPGAEEGCSSSQPPACCSSEHGPWGRAALEQRASAAASGCGGENTGQNFSPLPPFPAVLPASPGFVREQGDGSYHPLAQPRECVGRMSRTSGGQRQLCQML